MRKLPKALPAWLMSVVAGSGFAAETVRVTTWDCAAASPQKPASNIIEQTALQLKKLAPDVVLLRGVSGWKMCSQLTEALKPADYRVVVCSAFRPAEGSTAPVHQVAILARNSGYFSWSEPWTFQTNAALGGGFAFAAVQVAGHRFGFSCLELGGSQRKLSEQAAQQWLTTIDSFRVWSNNRLEGFVTGVFGFNYPEGETGRLLRAAGFADPLAGSAQSIAVEQTLEAHLVPDPDSPRGLVLNRWPLTCELDFRPAPIIVVAANPAPTPTQAKALASNSVFERAGTFWWLGIALLLVLSLIVLMQVGMRRKLTRLQAQSALIPISSGSYNVMLPPPAGATSETSALPPANLPVALPTSNPGAGQETLLANLSQWLKQAFVQRLLRDRRKLLQVQEAATIKALAVDERLAKLEAKIQSQNAAYEKQIEELTRELLTAREENCDLIRAQINMLKAEMATTRARMLASESVA